MRWATFQATDSLTVYGPGWGQTFVPGTRIDLDARVPDGRATWAEVLGPYVSLFVVDEDEAPVADVQEDPDGV